MCSKRGRYLPRSCTAPCSCSCKQRQERSKEHKGFITYLYLPLAMESAQKKRTASASCLWKNPPRVHHGHPWRSHWAHHCLTGSIGEEKVWARKVGDVVPDQRQSCEESTFPNWQPLFLLQFAELQMIFHIHLRVSLQFANIYPAHMRRILSCSFYRHGMRLN